MAAAAQVQVLSLPGQRFGAALNDFQPSPVQRGPVPLSGQLHHIQAVDRWLWPIYGFSGPFPAKPLPAADFQKMSSGLSCSLFRVR